MSRTLVAGNEGVTNCAVTECRECAVTEPTDYHGPPRKAEDVIRAAFSNPELMRQLVLSYEAELRGDLGTPLKELRAKRRTPRSA